MKSMFMPVRIMLPCIFFFLSCNFYRHDESAGLLCNKPKIINPNGDSEMALLMRSMHDEAARLKKAIADKDDFGAFPAKFHTIHSAIPIDTTVRTSKKEIFNSFALAYLKNMENIYIADNSKKTDAYNTMVQTCIGCHKHFCPGPMSKIKKLIYNPS